VKRGGLALLALALSGCPVPQVKPDTNVTQQQLPSTVPELMKYAEDMAAKQNVVDMENALMALDKAHTIDPKNYEIAWKAAKASEWLAEELYDDATHQGDKTKRAHYAGVGIDYAKSAIEDNPKGVEGHYYSGINIGLSATTKVIGAKFDVPKVRDAEKKAVALDACYDHGGPLRVLGSVYAQAPPWPASIGDVGQGIDYLQKALKCAPDYAQNNLLLGDAYQPKPGDTHFLEKWKHLAEAHSKELATKSNGAASCS
jgi:tetratricopeptide (TPR) repeat protein